MLGAAQMLRWKPVIALLLVEIPKSDIKFIGYFK